MDQIKALNGLAERRGQSLADMALAWILHHKGITSVLVGASSVEQLSDNLRCQHAPEFTEEELSLIEQIVKQ
jgi:L-glyceraldehyde 3-phosphate reductase